MGNLQLIRVVPNGNFSDSQCHPALLILLCLRGLLVVNFLHNTTALFQTHYKFVGYIIAMSLVQGGPGPICFALWVLAYGLESVVDDVLSDSIKNCLHKVTLLIFVISS